MARLNVNQLIFDEEVESTKKIKNIKKFKDDTFDDSSMKKQYKRKR